MKIVTVVGARPQFVKAAAVSRAIRDAKAPAISEVLVHTGQHHDHNMSDVFFRDLEIPDPDYRLDISGGSHGEMTGRMIIALEPILVAERPDQLLVYGDTNSTLAAVIAASKLCIPIAHVEAGVRSFRLTMPEEVNRVVTDRLSSLLFCPTETAVRNLKTEGKVTGVHNVGDVMFDIVKRLSGQTSPCSKLVAAMNLQAEQYALATCHRAENTDNREILSGILKAFGRIAALLPVVMPLHPRSRQRIIDFGLEAMLRNIRIVEPLPFPDMLALEQGARVILTDSGGVQKEAFFLQTPCVTLREETEWPETLKFGRNRLAGTNDEEIFTAFAEARLLPRVPPPTTNPFGSGDASSAIVSLMTA